MTRTALFSGAPPAEPAHSTTAGKSPLAAWLVVLVIAGAVAFGGHYLVDKRRQSATTMTLGSAVLGAQQIPVGPSDAATVISVQVAVGDVVRAGQTLGQIALAASVSGGASGDTGVLSAPADGVIVSVDRPAGSVVKAGEPVVTEYSSASLTFLAPVPVTRAQQLRIGMVVLVAGPGLSAPIRATVGSAQASLDGANPNVVDVAVVPARLSDVRDLVPGLAFRATVQLTDYPEDAPLVLRGGR